MTNLHLAINIEFTKGDITIFETQGGHLSFDIPEDCDGIILCGNSGGGYQPYRCLLPHQVYVNDIKRDFREHKFESIYVLPIRTKDSILLAGKNEYCLNRWQQDYMN